MEIDINTDINNLSPDSDSENSNEQKFSEPTEEGIVHNSLVEEKPEIPEEQSQTNQNRNNSNKFKPHGNQYFRYNPNRDKEQDKFQNSGNPNNRNECCNVERNPSNEQVNKEICPHKTKYGHHNYPVVSPVVEIQFKNLKRKLYRNDSNILLKDNDNVIVEIEGGYDIGLITSCGNHAKEKQKTLYKIDKPDFTIIRKATMDDLSQARRNRDDESRVIEKTKEFVHNLKLDMKITESEWQFDRQRLTIYFTAPQRIDFRELVKELARIYKTRIELRQISTREEAKRIGGMGPCGRHLCCSSFIHDFCHVTLDHARTQQLSNNVAKLSGYCGRLKCCLLYEYENYLEAFKKYPSLNSTIILPEGNARIMKVDIFKDTLLLTVAATGIFKTITLEELVKLDNEGKVIPPEKDEDKFPSPEIFFDDDVDLQALEEEEVY